MGFVDWHGHARHPMHGPNAWARYACSIPTARGGNWFRNAFPNQYLRPQPPLRPGFCRPRSSCRPKHEPSPSRHDPDKRPTLLPKPCLFPAKPPVPPGLYFPKPFPKHSPPTNPARHSRPPIESKMTPPHSIPNP